MERGQLLFVVEATDTVQALNDFIGASTAVNKARAALDFARITAKRNNDLYAGKAVPLKDVQIGAGRPARRGERYALRRDGARDRAQPAAHPRPQRRGHRGVRAEGADQPRYAGLRPIGGTVVQRKVGPGQYVSSGASDPVYVVGDLSTVWLTAFVREPEAPRVQARPDA